MAADAPFDGIGLAFQLNHFIAQLIKGLALVGYMAFNGLLKSPGTLLYFLGMFLDTIKGRGHEHG